MKNLADPRAGVKGSPVRNGAGIVKHMAQTRLPTCIDLFCGAGGLTRGLVEAGFRSVLAVDHWQPALDTFETNFPGIPLLRADIQDLTGEDLLRYAGLSEPPTALVGGPPCQGFTSAGSRVADDRRNSLVSEFARLAVEAQPSVVLFENVEGFLTLDQGRFVVDLLDPLVEAGYHVELQKVNVANYGVPQLRKRVIVIGLLGSAPGFPSFTHRAFGAPGAHRDDALHLPRSPTLLEAVGHLPKPAAEPPGEIPDHYLRTVGKEELTRIRGLGPGQTMRDLPESLQHDSYARRANRRVADGVATEKRGGAPAGLRRLLGDEPSKAITSAAIREFIHPVDDRPLTLRECATIQTFPEDFHFSGTVTDRATLIGNAIPPKFGEVLGHHLRCLANPSAVAPHLRRREVGVVRANRGEGHEPGSSQGHESGGGAIWAGV